MFNLIRSLHAAQYGGRVSLSLGPDKALMDASIFPCVLPLVRKARIAGMSAQQCAQLLLGAVEGVDRPPPSAVPRTCAINSAFAAITQDSVLWGMIERRMGTQLQP